MGRALLVLRTDNDRYLARHWITKAPLGTRVEYKAPKRTTDQNSRMWAMLTDVALQAEHNGRKYTAPQWKVLFLHASGREVQYMLALDGSDWISWGQSSSDLSKEEMSELLDFIGAWGAERGVVFGGQEQEAA